MGFFEWLSGEEPSIFEKINYMATHNWDTGGYGEYLTEYMFQGGNIDGYFKTLHNIYIPYRGRTSEIDVLLIHETGLYVIESKNYSGWIFGSAEQSQWTQVLNKNNKNRFYNPIKQNKTHINALSDFLELDKSLMRSYIVFSERCELKKVPDDTKEYTILRRHHLLKSLKVTMKKSEAILTPEKIIELYNKLLPLTNVSESIKQDHIDNIQSRYK